MGALTLGPQGPDSTHRLFNPDAGGHALPDDAREIDAVLQATQRCYEAHPYLEARYGARGRRFTNSDGGYLVTLTAAWQSHVNEQVEWLARLLSARGMPTWLMECHLLLLQAELRRRIPEGAARFVMLRRAANRLKSLRCSRMSQHDFDAVAAAFAGAAGPGLANAGGLIAAAVCDERAGWTESVASLADWLGDPVRFPAPWCRAVAQALARARSSDWPGARFSGPAAVRR